LDIININETTSAGVILVNGSWDVIDILVLSLLFIGLFLLLIGFLLKKHKVSHVFLMIGWVTFGLFWLTQVPHFLEIGDTFNALFCLFGFILFLYFTYHEALNFKWNEYLYPLNYIAGVAAVSGLFYYIIERFEPLAKGLIYVVASQSVWLYNLFGYNATLTSFSYDIGANEYFLPIAGTEYEGMRISIILACTGIQSIAIFIGILIVTRSNRSLWAPWTKKFLAKPAPEEIIHSKFKTWLWHRKKNRLNRVLNMSDRGRYIRVFLYTVPVVYILNIFRNALIMYGHVNATLGPDTYNIAHNYLSKGLSLFVLIILIFLVFEILPECQEAIIGLFDLPKRLMPGMVKDGFVDIDAWEEKMKKRKKTNLKKQGTKTKETVNIEKKSA
jgi:archaeosortase A (PGF-CTERM-specific)